MSTGDVRGRVRRHAGAGQPAVLRDGGVRLTGRGRAVVIALVAALMIAALWVGTRRAGTAATGAATTAGRDGSHAVRVRPGDTLWEIARRHEPHADPRRTVSRIRELNDLDTPLVRPGQHLRLPS